MRLHRFLNEDLVALELQTIPIYGELVSVPDTELQRVREGVIGEFAELFNAAGLVSNLKRLKDDLMARELRTSTAVGSGIAWPHVRTQQARRFALAVARSTPGLPFGAPDGGLVHVFVSMVAPPHDDKVFLRVEQLLAEAFSHDTELYDAILAAESPGEIVRAMSRLT